MFIIIMPKTISVDIMTNAHLTTVLFDFSSVVDQDHFALEDSLCSTLLHFFSSPVL